MQMPLSLLSLSYNYSSFPPNRKSDWISYQHWSRIHHTIHNISFSPSLARSKKIRKKKRNSLAVFVRIWIRICNCDKATRRRESSDTIRYGFVRAGRYAKGLDFRATLPITLSRKGFHPPSFPPSPRNAFTRSLAYHASGGARKGLNPRPITIHFGLSAGSSRSSIPPFPASCITIRIRVSSAWPVYLSVQWSDSSKRSAAWDAIFFSSFSSPSLTPPSLPPPPPYLTRYFSDYGNLVIRGTDGGLLGSTTDDPGALLV